MNDFNKMEITEQVLKDLYLTQNKSISQLCKIFNSSKHRIKYFIKKFSLVKSKEQRKQAFCNTYNNLSEEYKQEINEKRKHTWKNKDEDWMNAFRQKVSYNSKQNWNKLTEEEKQNKIKQLVYSFENKSPEEQQYIKEKAVQKWKQVWNNKSIEEKQIIADKISNSLQNKSQEEKQETIRKFKDSWYNVGDEQKLKRRHNFEKGLQTRSQHKEQIEEKKRQSLLEKYNVTNVAQLQEVKQKHQQSWNSKTEDQKQKIKDKIKISCQNTWKNMPTEQKQKYIDKIKNTKDKNKTWTISKQEDIIFQKLKTCFPNYEIKRQYSSAKYPFKCDFYIIQLDLYIEFNGTWTHGKHPFDKNNSQDIELLETWQQKAVTSKFYQNAIKVWTISDIIKRTIAKDNNLNYLEFFTMDQLEDWINSGLTIN